MKKYYISMLLLLTCSSCVTKPINTLRKHMNQDLRTYSSLKDVGDVVRAALIVAGGSSHFPFYITEMTTYSGVKLLIYIENAPIDDFHPGDRAIRISILAPEEHSCALPMFWIGTGRTFLDDISVLRSSGDNDVGDILVISTQYGIFAGVSKQFYAISNFGFWWARPFSLSLVRRESQDGNIFFNSYSLHEGNWVAETGAMIVGANSAQEWIDRLSDEFPAQILSTLFFLCSDHSDCDEEEYPGVAKQIPNALLILKEKTDILDTLLKHENAWIREYADILKKKLETMTKE